MRLSEVTGITFADSVSAPVLKFLNPDFGPTPKVFQICQPDCCSNSENHLCNNYHIFPKPFFSFFLRPRRLLILPKIKSDSGSWSDFSNMFDSDTGSGPKETQNPAIVDSGTSVPWPHLRTVRKHTSQTCAEQRKRVRHISNDLVSPALSQICNTNIVYFNCILYTSELWESAALI